LTTVFYNFQLQVYYGPENVNGGGLLAMSFENNGNQLGNGNLTPGMIAAQFAVTLDFGRIGAINSGGAGEIPFGANLMVPANSTDVPAPPNASGVTNFSVTTQKATALQTPPPLGSAVADQAGDTLVDSTTQQDRQD
jgi:hypothetical protein